VPSWPRDSIVEAPIVHRFFRIILSTILGFAIGVAVGWFAVLAFSSNAHDRNLEAAMTAIFVTGPLGAVAGLVTGLMRKPSSPPGN
jgi:hypothetical protein